MRWLILRLPEDCRDPVTAAFALAEAEYLRTKPKDVGPWIGPWRTPDQLALLRCARRYIETVALVFAKQCCVAVRHGRWTPDQTGEEAERFLQEMIEAVYSEFSESRELGGWDSFSRDTRESIRQSADWLEHLAERAELARGRLASQSTDWPKKKVSARLKAKRRQIVTRYRRSNDLKAEGLAQQCQLDPSVIRAIVREDWTKFDVDTQTNFLNRIGVKRDDWYRL